MPEDRYFQLADHVGVNANGNPEPLHEIGVAINVPTMRDGEIVDMADRVTVKPIPGTRTVKVSDPLVAAGLLQSGLVVEIDPPTKTDLSKERKVTQDAREQAGTIENGEEA